MRSMLRAFAAVTLLAAFVAAADAQLSIQAIDVTGDSISKGFNARSAAPCSNADQETYNWLTSDTHGTAFCSAGSEAVFSVLEQLECDMGSDVPAAFPNHAVSGATLVRDLVSQAQSVHAYLSGQPATRLAVVFLGHNDNCSGSATKTNTSCSNSDLDPANYCKTRPDSFEREVRKGFDILMSTSDTRIGVMSPVRVSQLCNFGSKTNCQLGGTCQFLWGLVNICTSLTRDCSTTRIADTYTTLRMFHNILKSVSEEYAAIPPGGMSRIVMIGGQTVGGGVKAPGAEFVFSDGPWYYRFNADQLSCCDCFHPSAVGQNALARLMKSGLSCSRLNPCCRDTGDPVSDGRCATLQRKRVSYPGLF